jgi:hypothetical protein
MEQVSRLKWLAVPDPIGGHLRDPAVTDPGLPNVLRHLFRPQHPADGAAVADNVVGCLERDLAFPLELTADLTVQSLPGWLIASLKEGFAYAEGFDYTVRWKSAPWTCRCPKTVSFDEAASRGVV